MQVSFTSISNPCHIGLRSFIDENEEFNSFSVIVKDDRFGNDYSDYKKALQRSNQECNYLSDINHNLVNLMVNKKTNEDTLVSTYTFRLNGKELPINNSTMPIFDFLAKITGIIKNTKAKDIIINRDYIHSDEFKYGLIPGLNMENFIPHDEASTDDYENAAELYRHPTSAKVGAEIVNNSIQEAMMDYFA